MKKLLPAIFFIGFFFLLLPGLYAQSPTITVTSATGSIIACEGTASASPNIQQFTVSGTNLVAAILVTAPAGFELTINNIDEYSSIVLMDNNGMVNNTVIYVRSLPNDLAGNISGKVVLTSTGAADQFVEVGGTVNALPTVNQVPSQTIANGATTTAVNFTGTGNVFNWTNDTPGIGLAANGTGNISAFTAINSGNTSVTATITVTSINEQAEYEYMTDETAKQVSVISNVTNSIVSTIDVGAGPYGIALSPDGSMAYVSNYIGSSVSVINTSSNKVVATIPVGYNPIGIAVSPDGSKVYVCCYLGLNIIDATKNQLITGILLSNYIPSGVTVSPDGKWIYVTDPNNNALVIINSSTYQQTRVYIPTNIEDSAFYVAVSPDGSLIYVTGADTNNVYVINAISQAIVKTINLSAPAIGIAISPNGNRIYVTNEFSNMVSVVDATSGAVITTIPVGTSPEGISVSPDGSTVYVSNVGSNNMSVINTSNNQVTTTVGAGANPHSLGNFVKSSIGCSGPPATFTITVKPTVVIPTITTTVPTGTISACVGTPSADPNIEQFNASGTNLTGDITVTAPTGFEVSRDIGGTYSGSLTLTQTLGSVGSSLIYVRSAATAPAGNIPPNTNVILSSAGATNQTVALSGTIFGIPSANTPPSQTKINGQATDPVIFTGNASSYTWVNGNTSIGLAAGGTGDIPSFTAINNTGSPITATITVTPVNGADCGGSPDEFYITVDPTPTVLNVPGTLTPLTTVYGTASSAESFTVSCSTVGAKILVTPPAGFEVSSDGTTFSNTVTITNKASNSPVTVYIRLASSTHTGNYSGDVIVSTANATNATITMPLSTVTPAVLTITADNKTKPYGGADPPLTVTYSGFVNNDVPAQLTALPVLTTIATASSAVGQYTIYVNGASATDYTFAYNFGVLTVTPSLSLQDIPNTFTPNGDGRNDTWVINGLQYYPVATVNIFNRWGQKLYYSVGYPIPWDGTYHGKALPTGTYYFIIDLKNKQPVIAGWVGIIR